MAGLCGASSVPALREGLLVRAVRPVEVAATEAVERVLDVVEELQIRPDVQTRPSWR